MADNALRHNEPPKIGSLLASLLGIGGGEGLRFWEILSIFGFAMGIGGIDIYARSSGHTGFVFSILALVGTAAWLVGGVLGFLFGVPRLRASTGQVTGPSTFVPNTNLEQISDWLTKAIVGATLVQLGPLFHGLSDMSAKIGTALQAPAATEATGAVMTLYAAGGFMWGYLWCSLRIFKEMSGLVTREQAVTAREAAAPE